METFDQYLDRGLEEEISDGSGHLNNMDYNEEHVGTERLNIKMWRHVEIEHLNKHYRQT